MNKRRLLKLADMLEAVADDKNGVKFNLGTYVLSKDPSMPLNCKTQACALGLAALSGGFKRSGLSIIVHDGDAFVVLKGRHNYYGMDAATELFDLADEDARWLFLPGSYEGPLTGRKAELKVAKRIRYMVHNGSSWPVQVESI